MCARMASVATHLHVLVHAALVATTLAATSVATVERLDNLLSSAAASHAAGETSAAKASLRQALQIAPTAGIASFELGNCLFAPLQAAAEAGQPVDDASAAQAESAFRAALAVDRTDSSLPVRLHAPIGMTYNNLANLLSVQGRSDEAEALLRAGLRIEPIAYQYNGLAGLLLDRVGEEDARRPAAVPSGLVTDPSSPPSPPALLQEAVELLRRAIEHERTQCATAPRREAVYHDNLADALHQLGRGSEAQAHVQRALALSTASPAPQHSSTLPTGGTRGAFEAGHASGWGPERRRLVFLLPSGHRCSDRSASVASAAAPSAATAASTAFASGADSLHTCGCPARFGLLQDVGASAAAMGALGYAVEVCGCVPIMHEGVDANSTRWSASERYEGGAATRGAHILVYVDAPRAHGHGGSVESRWLWRRNASAQHVRSFPPSGVGSLARSRRGSLGRSSGASGGATSAIGDGMLGGVLQEEVGDGARGGLLDEDLIGMEGFNGLNGLLQSPAGMPVATAAEAAKKAAQRAAGSRAESETGRAKTAEARVEVGGARTEKGRAPGVRVVEGRATLLDPAFLHSAGRGLPRPSSRLCYTQPPEVGLLSLIEMWPKVGRPPLHW